MLLEFDMKFSKPLLQKHYQRFTICLIFAAGLTTIECQHTDLAMTVPFPKHDHHCDNRSEFYNSATYSMLHCDTSYTKQHCNVTDDKEWECLLQMADMQTVKTCECKRQKEESILPSFNDQYCKSLEFCVFMEKNWNCNPSFKCVESREGQSGIKCTKDHEVFFPTCSRHLLYCKARTAHECLFTAMDTFTSILAEECLWDKFEDRDVFFFVQKAHIANESYTYGNIMAIDKYGEDVTSKYCTARQDDWRYIVTTVVTILLLSLGGYGFYRFKRRQKSQDRIWETRMNRIFQCNIVFTSDLTQESHVANTIHEQCDEIVPQGTVVCDEKSELDSGNLARCPEAAIQHEEQNKFPIDTTLSEISSFDNATYGEDLSIRLRNYENASVFFPSTSAYSESDNVNSARAFLGNDTLASPPMADGYTRQALLGKEAFPTQPTILVKNSK